MYSMSCRKTSGSNSSMISVWCCCEGGCEGNEQLGTILWWFLNQATIVHSHASKSCWTVNLLKVQSDRRATKKKLKIVAIFGMAHHRNLIWRAYPFNSCVPPTASYVYKRYRKKETTYVWPSTVLTNLFYRLKLLKCTFQKQLYSCLLLKAIVYKNMHSDDEATW